MSERGADTDERSSYTREEAADLLMENYDYSDDADGVALSDLAVLHNGGTSYLALYDQATDDDMTLPDDLSPDARRRLATARTNLLKAVRDLEDAAADRLNELDDEGVL